MSEQILMPIGNNSEKALNSLEKAREAHERYLIKQQNSDLQEAIDNNNKEYALVFINKDTEEGYISEINSWKESTPYDLGEENGKSYTDSWFKGEIDLTNIPNGDYEIYMLAATDDYFTMSQQQINDMLHSQSKVNIPGSRYEK